MSDRLTDTQVAKYTTWPESRGALAREVQEMRGLRPKCPELRPMNNRIGPRFGSPDHRSCPANCEDGFMPLADWVQLLRDSLVDAYTLLPPERVKLLRPFAADAVAAVLKTEDDR